MKNTYSAIEAVAPPSVSRPVKDEVCSVASSPVVHLLRGRRAVAGMADMLEVLAVRSGQAGTTHWLQYHLSTPTAVKKIPTLVLVGLRAGVAAADAGADDVMGAALLYEYRFLGLGTRVFATGNTTGWGTVISPAECRAQVAEEVCRSLVECGALAALITFQGRAADKDGPVVRDGKDTCCRIATRNRSFPWHLVLAETLDATLARLGRHTRRNLRYYRRRLEAEIGVRFVANVAMTREEFLAMNRASINPVDDALAGWRYDSILGVEGALFDGVQTNAGQWLSLIGGRRHRQLTEIDWQVNRAGLQRYSLSTAMRSYLLEHEVALGTHELAFTGGTPHSMRHSFACVDAADVIALRQSAAGRALRRMARWVLPETNFLGHALRDETLSWTKA